MPLTRDAYVLRKQLAGLVIGPLDRNKGELCLCCPKLYQKALRAMHTEQTGYTEVKTDEKTLMKEWKKEYRRMGWSKYGVFDAKGGLNTPYALFKMKNMGVPNCSEEGVEQKCAEVFQEHFFSLRYSSSASLPDCPLASATIPVANGGRAPAAPRSREMG